MEVVNTNEKDVGIGEEEYVNMIKTE